MRRRTFSLAAASAVAWPGAAFADDYPVKPIRLVVPFAPGISPDVVGRFVGDKLSGAWRQPVVVDNRPGAAGMIGAEAVAASPADGYTLLIAATSVMAINPHVYRKMRYDALKDFVPVAELLTVPYVLTAPPNAPFNNMDELVRYARQRPGQVDYASLGIGSQPHVAMEVWQKRLGIKLNHVPYKTSPSADLMAGVVSLFMDPSTTAIPLVQGKKVKAIAVTGRSRIASLPDVPTADEFMPGLATTAWQGIFVPKGTPPQVVEKLGAEFVRIVSMPEVKAKFAELGLEATGVGSVAFAKTVAGDHAQWGRVVRDLGVTLD